MLRKERLVYTFLKYFLHMRSRFQQTQHQPRGEKGCTKDIIKFAEGSTERRSAPSIARRKKWPPQKKYA